jgi:hypothetical protein
MENEQDERLFDLTTVLVASDPEAQRLIELAKVVGADYTAHRDGMSRNARIAVATYLADIGQRLERRVLEVKEKAAEKLGV